MNYSNYTGKSKDGNLNSDAIGKIILNYPDINLEWLITGVGTMTRDKNCKSNEYCGEPLGKSIPLLPVNEQGGYLDDFVAQVTRIDCESILSPIKDVDFGITVVGDSMEPRYPNGSIVLIKKINERAFIEWGKVFVLDTINGIVVKQLKPSTNDGFVSCCSYNEDYPPFEVAMEDLNGIYKVMMVLSMV
ncbi:S24 family peptidase [Halosquirtibacter laminarini]|uniref:S24 family peptidase n=1 Tax=Halosquirtibacter laminarini TaxID=3374600 RepID=A0AC61NHV8_9BACT|nr:S24 family peptidase [Prolixibacteraceae bacterium]